MSIVSKIFGTYSDHQLRKLEKIADRIEALAPTYKDMGDEELRGMTQVFRNRLAAGETLDDILPDAFAAVREADDRVLGKRPFHVQLLGGIILHQGRIAEMKTGEGKTLVATMPAYLNALTGNGVHIVTVNDYLAARDAEEMGKVYGFMGLTTGLVVHGQTQAEKHAAYNADITYGTNNEYGFDYLRDNMVVYKERVVQRGHAFAIVDEVDSILIDEARTPLIISGEGEKPTDLYERADQFVRTLRKYVVTELDAKEEHDDIDADYIVDEKANTAVLTPHGVVKAEKFFSLPAGTYTNAENATLAHHINQAIKAHGCMKLDVDYVVNENGVMIVDAFTGRLMPGRRFSDGLHQAIEAKEGVSIQKENKTLATITFQNYFRMYKKLAGMTGTAKTEATEFTEIYGLNIVTVPTNRPNVRKDYPDAIYKTINGKYNAVIQQVMECHKNGQPVLVGTVSVEKSETLAKMLQKYTRDFNVLNAKNHEREAEIVAQAGKKGAITIATNMAGRGTDIMLGGNAEYLSRADLVKAGYSEEVIVDATGYADTDNEDILAARKLFAERMAYHKAIIKEEAEKVRAAGGLFIIGTERHESRRIDNQLRGRAGRQGDPGETRFYISLEDDLMRLFGGDRIQNMMEKFDLDEDTPIENKMLTRAIENAQTTVESRNFQSRKSVLEYDDVMNKQREIIYAQRRQVLDGLDIKETVLNMMHTSVSNHVALAFGENQHLDAAQYHEMLKGMEGIYFAKGAVEFSDEEIPSKTQEDFDEAFIAAAEKTYEAKEQEVTTPIMRELERVIMLRVVDEYWMDHIDAMDDLKQGVRLQGYGNNNPVDVYKRESLDMFEEMVSAIQDETVRRLYSVRLRKDEEVKRERVAKATVENVGGDGTTPKKQPVKKTVKIGRNDPCPCGSGLKWKKCTCKEYHPDL